MHTELMQVGSVGRIECAAAIVFEIGIVVRDPFTAQIVVGAEHLARNLLRTTLVAAVVIRGSLVVCQELRFRGAESGCSEEDGEDGKLQ